jgi:hypothetical protein
MSFNPNLTGRTILMNPTIDQKTWEKPQLIVLVRNMPEEVVLAACKGGASTDFGAADGDCTIFPGCAGCSDSGAS